MKTVLVKRIIEEDGLPDGFGVYYTDEGELKFVKGNNSFYNYENQQRNPKFWYEKIELSKLLEEVMPTAIELRNDNILMKPLGECEKVVEWFKSKIINKIK